MVQFQQLKSKTMEKHTAKITSKSIEQSGLSSDYRKVIAEYEGDATVQDFTFMISKLRRRHIYDHILYDTE